MKMKVDRSSIQKNLPKKGFRKEKSGHHIYFYHEHEGQETGAYTYISHTAKLKDYSGDLLTSMKKQLKLETARETVDLVKCPMDKKKYNSLLIQRMVFTPDSESEKWEIVIKRVAVYDDKKQLFTDSCALK